MKIILAWLLAISFTCSGAPAKWYGRVKVSTSSQVPTLESLINRELRTIPDITVCDTNFDYELGISCLSHKNLGGVTVGYCLSLVVTRPFPIGTISIVETNPTILNIIQKITPDYVLIEDHILFIDNDLTRLVKEMVARFDSVHLESDRRLFDRIAQQFKASTTAAGQTNTSPFNPEDQPIK